MNNIKEIAWQLTKVLKDESLTYRQRLISYCDYIINALYNIKMHYYPDIDLTEEYKEILTYAKQIKHDLELNIDLDPEN